MKDEFSRATIRSLLVDLADEGRQRCSWMRVGSHEVSSFDETVCSLFDDTGLGEALARGTEPVFTIEIDAALRELERQSTMASRLFRTMPPEEIITHPQCEHIRGIASTIIEKMEA